ncbi:XRE family transcriptional regulator [Streptomyces sp. STCH 565 A]|uniref:XRE family transcriptional regulator n=1 Tax=Streptomyces sp. STCH 565 A TaxID=2950532 RepID=UPI0020750C62|nr:XRE family transcriptional regulator [Streptomyces sp. STCH 565 A]MCM8548864.1 XRE family transcriptional regulator [Streptomyces sp. STCH 565 A]
MASRGEQHRTDLSDLVRERMAALGLSFRALAAACIDPEGEPSDQMWKRTTLDALSKGEAVKPPKLPQLRALAAGLRLPLGQVQEAAGSQFFGIDTVWSADGEVRTLVEGYRDMAPEDQAKVLALVEARRRVWPS